MSIYDYETKELIHKERNDPYQISFNVNVFSEGEAAIEHYYYFPIQHKAWISINGKSYLDMFEFMKYFNDTNTCKVLYWLIQCQKQNRNTHTCSQLIHYTSLDKNQLCKIFVDLLTTKLISVNTFIFDGLAVVRVHSLTINEPEKQI